MISKLLEAARLVAVVSMMVGVLSRLVGLLEILVLLVTGLFSMILVEVAVIELVDLVSCC